MKKIIISGIIAIFMLNMYGCEGQESAEHKQQRQTNQALAEMDRQIGMPDIHNFQEKKMMKLVMEERDRADLICYAYVKSEYTGKFNFIGKCIGYGLPYSTEFTNPQKVTGYNSAPAVIAQADPNGLYMPQSASATWLFMINPETGKPVPVYCEDNVLVLPYKLPASACVN